MNYAHIFNSIEERNVADNYKVIVKKYIESQMAAGWSINTIKGKGSVIFQLILWLSEDNQPVDIFKEEQTFNSYIAHMKMIGLKESTVSTNKIFIKGFLTWYFGKESPEYLLSIKYKKIRKELMENNLLKPSEILIIAEKAHHQQDKALVLVLGESAARINELLSMNIEDVEFRERETIIKLRTSKTKKREIPLFDATVDLMRWIDQHPFKNDPKAPLFISRASNYYGHRLYAGTVGHKLKSFAKLGGITKRIHCHLFRHSRISWWAKVEKMNERDLRILCGWAPNSDMPSVYIHYGFDGVLEKMRNYRGISDFNSFELEKEKQALKPLICGRCGKQNPADSLFCNCGMALKYAAVKHLDEIKKQETELHTQILSKNTNSIQLDADIDLKELMYRILREDPKLIEKLKNIMLLDKKVENNTEG